MKFTKQTETQRRPEANERQKTSATDDRPTLRCTISACSARAIEDVDHPQRGDLAVCRYHAQQIRELPEWRFIGITEVESDHREVIER